MKLLIWLGVCIVCREVQDVPLVVRHARKSREQVRVPPFNLCHQAGAAAGSGLSRNPVDDLSRCGPVICGIQVRAELGLADGTLLAVFMYGGQLPGERDPLVALGPCPGHSGPTCFCMPTGHHRQQGIGFSCSNLFLFS